MSSLFLLVLLVVVVDLYLEWLVDRLLAGLGVVGLVVMALSGGLLLRLVLLVVIVLGL